MIDFKFDMHTVILIINIVTFLLFGLDKIKAKSRGWRIPEIVRFLPESGGGDVKKPAV